jgi:hypothetical protein
MNNVKTIVANNWQQLVEELFADSHNPNLDRYRSPFAFRGMADKDFKLETTLMRLRHSPDILKDIERRLLSSFRKYAYKFFDVNYSDWHWISVAQHHGLPTRLLDWSFSPFVAMHFATEDLAKMDKDGIVWCVNFKETQSFLPQDLQQILERDWANFFSIETLAEMFPKFEQFDEPDKYADFILFFEPPSMDERIVNQVALFSFTSRAGLQLDEWLGINSMTYPSLCKKVIIPANLKWEIRDKLDQANITERVLFPGLDGLSKWLKRWYTPKNPIAPIPPGRP